MPVISCPQCQKTYQSQKFVSGQRVRCPKCQHRFSISGPPQTSDPDSDGDAFLAEENDGEALHPKRLDAEERVAAVRDRLLQLEQLRSGVQRPKSPDRIFFSEILTDLQLFVRKKQRYYTNEEMAKIVGRHISALAANSVEFDLIFDALNQSGILVLLTNYTVKSIFLSDQGWDALLDELERSALWLNSFFESDKWWPRCRTYGESGIAALGVPLTPPKKFAAAIELLKANRVDDLMDLARREKTTEWRRGYLVLLGLLGESAAVAFDAIADIVAHGPNELFGAAGMALVRISRTEHDPVPLILNAVFDPARGGLNALAAMEAIAEYEPLKTRAWPHLVTCVTTGQPEGRQRALKQFRSLPQSEAALATPTLKAAMENEALADDEKEQLLAALTYANAGLGWKFLPFQQKAFQIAIALAFAIVAVIVVFVIFSLGTSDK